MATIYVITNQINGKQYVGATKFSLEKRFNEHYRDMKKERCRNRPLYSDMNKYGIENFYIEAVEECSEEDRFNRELYWVDKLDTYNSGYNFTFGGTGKHFYDYKAIADKYLELKTVKDVCRFFNCDPVTVKAACEEYNIKIIPGKEQNKLLYSKSVDMLDINTGKLLKTFISISEAHKFLNVPRSKHITDVCNCKNKTAYGYKWRWHEESNSELAS